MHVGVLRIHFRVYDARSLKDKRQVVQSLKGRIQSRFNVSVAEIGDQDVWTSCELGVAMIGSDRRYVNGALDKIFEFVMSHPAIGVVEHDIEFY
jgi:hypothetical protein